MVVSKSNPDQMTRYCSELVPSMLTEVCGVGAQDAQLVAEDIWCRAETVARLDGESMEGLAAPFFEESYFHHPDGASPWMKAITTLVIRNSRLEELHASGQVNAGGIEAITTYGLPPLSALITDTHQRQLQPPLSGLPVTVDRLTAPIVKYPRAWSCLRALRELLRNGGGRAGYPSTAAPPPDLPQPEEVIDALGPRDFLPAPGTAAVVLSGIDARFDREMLRCMQDAAEGDGYIVGVSALSRISRNSDKLLRVLEWFLAHRARILTTNYLLASGVVWVRQQELVRPDSLQPLASLRQPRGLSGLHRKTVQSYLKTTT